MKPIRKIIDILYKGIMYTVTIALGIMILTAFVEVIRRYIFGQSFIWGDDLIRYMIIYVGFVGGAAAYKDNNLASLDLVTSKLPRRAQVAVEIFVNAIVTVMIVFFLYYSIKAIQSPSIKYSTGIGLRIKLWIPYMPLAIGFAIMLLFSLEKFYDMFKKLAKGG